jgi:serine/threonine protein kinase
MTDGAGTTTRSEVGLFALAPGLSIGRYTITAVLGQGGFGITYRARDSQLNRDVAIKEYLPSSLAVRQDGVTVLPRSTEVAEDFTWGRDRFVAEGRTLASLTEAPGIVRVFDFLESNGTAYIVMELVPGETLEQRLRKQRTLSPQDIDAILQPLLDGLEQVHEAGFLHRDIKPANVLIRPNGRPVLIDFGASRAAMTGRSTAMTAIFTPGFAAAEQMTSAKQGPWTDIYGLAATMYAAIAGSVPPPAFDRMLEDTFRPLAELQPTGFSPALLAGLDAGLAVRAVERPQSIAAWRTQLQGGAPGVGATVAMPAQAPGATVIVSPSQGGPSQGGPSQGRPSQGWPSSLAAPPSQGAPSQGVPSQGTPSQGTPSQGTPSMMAPASAPAAARKPMALYAGVAVLALLVLGGGGYYALQDKPRPQTQSVALQDMKVEDLEKVLEARRKADAEAAEKRRLEEEAQKKATADTEAKQRADAELEKAKQDRLKAEQELAKLKAQLEEQKKAAADAQRQAQIEEEQRKAEAAAAEKRRLEEEAQKRADADARQKADAEAALVRAQAERARADADAKSKQEAEARQKADADAKTRAEAEAREKEKAAADKARAEAEAKTRADAEDKKLAEAGETGLKLSQADRTRLQIALTSQGFDTRGSDGAFGPRSREMIAAWQKARNLPATGFVNAAQQQQLQREAAAALQKYDEEKKAEEEAKAKLAVFDGAYAGLARVPTGTRALSVQVSAGNGQGNLVNPVCGSGPFAIKIAATGEITGQASGYDTECKTMPMTVTGRAAGQQLEVALSASGSRLTATLQKGAAVPQASDTASAPAAPAASTTPPTTTPAGTLDGRYGGSLVITRTGGAPLVTGMRLQISGGRATGEIIHRSCGTVPVSLTVSPAGLLSGSVMAADGPQNCSNISYSVNGKANGTDIIELVMEAPSVRASASLKRGAAPSIESSSATASAATPAPSPAPATSGSGPDGDYGGTIQLTRPGGGPGLNAPGIGVRVAGTSANGTMYTRSCGNPAFTLTVGADGRLSGNASLPDGLQGCGMVPYSVTGRVAGDSVELVLAGPGVGGRGTLRKGVAPSQPGGGAAPAPADTGGVPIYRGSLSAPAQMANVATAYSGDIRVANGRVTGQVSERRCGAFTLDMPVSSSGEFSGEFKFVDDAQCSPAAAKVTGRISADSLRIEIRAGRMTVSGTLPRSP